MNSVRHGLTAKAIVLSNESKEGFEELRKAYYTRFQPADEVESDLVDDMVAARWRIRRAWCLERVTIDVRQDRMMDTAPENRPYKGEPRVRPHHARLRKGIQRLGHSPPRRPLRNSPRKRMLNHRSRANL